MDKDTLANTVDAFRREILKELGIKEPKDFDSIDQSDQRVMDLYLAYGALKDIGRKQSDRTAMKLFYKLFHERAFTEQGVPIEWQRVVALRLSDLVSLVERSEEERKKDIRRDDGIRLLGLAGSQDIPGENLNVMWELRNLHIQNNMNLSAAIRALHEKNEASFCARWTDKRLKDAYKKFSETHPPE